MHIVSRFCSKAGTEYPVYPKLNGSRPLLHWEALPNLNDSIINTLLKKKAKGNQKGPQCTIFPCTAIFPDIFCNLLLQQRFEMLHNTPCYLSDLDVPRIIRLFLAPLSWRSPQRIRSISCNYLSVDLKKNKKSVASALHISDLLHSTPQKNLHIKLFMGLRCQLRCL